MYNPLALIEFIQKHVSAVSETYKTSSLAYFTASNSGKEEDYAIATETQLAREKIYSNKEDFQKIVEFRNADIQDSLLKRQLELLFLSYTSRQIGAKELEELIALQSKIESTFATFRAEIDCKHYTDNQIEETLSTSTDSEEVKEAWLASKAIGSVVEHDVIQIIKMRNTIAKNL
jgi:peptidyl-dipeptidase A